MFILNENNDSETELYYSGVSNNKRARRAERNRLGATLCISRAGLGAALHAAVKREKNGVSTAWDEMFIDEFYNLEKLLKTAWDGFFDEHYERLCVLKSGKYAFRSRLYALGCEYLKKSGWCVEAAELGEFFTLSQRGVDLSVRESECLIPMLRLILIEEAARIASKNPRFDEEDRIKKLRLILSSALRLSDADTIETAAGLNGVNALLMRDDVYKKTDRMSRGAYMDRVCAIAKTARVSERECALAALELARNGDLNAFDERAAHVGFYLLDDGQELLLRKLTGGRRGLRPRFFHGKNGERNRLIALISIRAVGTLLLSLAVAASGAGALGFALSLLPMAALFDEIILPLLLKRGPRPLVRLKSECVAGEKKQTLVCMPVLITDEKTIVDALERLEKHYIASDGGAQYCVLGDFKDAKTRQDAADEALVKCALERIKELDRRYGGDKKFHILIRKRSFLKADGVYMGRERKRGAIEDLIEYLSCGTSEKFIAIEPDLTEKIRYLAVLDADTILQRGALDRLIGAAAHPLNRPIYESAAAKRPFAGYNVIVPRMSSTSSSAVKTRFSRLISGDSGSSAYSRLVSDLFFDCFNSGNFGGKGLIDIEGFKRALYGAIDENTVLSHDLLEGELAKAAYDSSTVLFDGEPSKFFAWRKRRHRWLRGDIQLIGYVFGKKRRLLSPLSRYKLLSNIVLSFKNIAVFVAFFAGAAAKIPQLTAAALLSVFIAPILAFIRKTLTLYKGKSGFCSAMILLRRTIMELGALPFAAYYDADAIGRALYRTLFSHKKMLEWQTAASSDKASGKEYDKLLPSSLAGAILLTLYIINFSSANSFFAGFEYISGAIAAALMLIFPITARVLDGQNKQYAFSDEERRVLMDTAIGTWRFFEENCTEKTHYLPPDNFQQEPFIGACEHTSPTNIGMWLTSAVCALDLGFIDEKRLLFYMKKTADTLEKLEKWRGNFFNWYNIKNLSLLKPRFVSSVDCGNLFCALITAARALDELEKGFENGEDAAEAKRTAQRLTALALDMDLMALYDKKRRLFHTGLEFDEGRLTASCYDLYASEARLLSFAAIAYSKVEAGHFAALSRLYSDASGGRTLKSWSGTAFEYLMPLIFFETAEYSMQYEISKSAVLTQILNTKNGRIWGVSECGYFCFDDALRYQYRAFGDAELALRRERDADSVIAPYASCLALAVERKQAIMNIKRLIEFGAMGEYGLFEAIDFTKERVGNEPKTVKSFMAHHQGMSLAAINNALTGGIVRRFMSIPQVGAHEQLLFESVSEEAIKLSSYVRAASIEKLRKSAEPIAVFAQGGEPYAGLISNGSYSCAVSNFGGASFTGNIFLTPVRHDGGGARGIEIAVATQKTVKTVDGSMYIEPHKITKQCRIGALKARLECVVSAESSCEVRTLTLVNGGRESVKAAIGVFSRVALCSFGEYASHPAFMLLTVDSEIPPDEQMGQTALFYSRRKREKADSIGFFNIASPNEALIFTDGESCPCRGEDILSVTEKYFRGEIAPKKAQGGVKSIAPYFSALTSAVIGAGASVRITLFCGLATSREEAFETIKKHRLRCDTTEELIRGKSALLIRRHGITKSDFALCCRIAYCVLTDTPNKSIRETELIKTECGGREALYRFSISSDVPLLVVSVSSKQGLERAENVIRAAKYLHECGLGFELALIGEYAYEYQNPIRERLEMLSAGSGFIKLINAYSLSDLERNFIKIAALMIFEDGVETEPASLETNERNAPMKSEKLDMDKTRLCCYNGFGGFDRQAAEYVIHLKNGQKTPLPWSNILAGGRVSSLVTESGGGYTSFDNARLFRLTPWSNEPLLDGRGERVFLYDAKSGARIDITGQAGSERIVRHGFGYSVFIIRAEGLSIALTELCDDELSVKYYSAEIENRCAEERKLIFELSVDAVLGERVKREHIVAKTMDGGVFIKNPMEIRRAGAFLAVGSGCRLVSAKTGANSRIKAGFSVPSGEKRRAVLLLGAALNEKDAKRTAAAADFEAALIKKRAYKENKLDRLKIKTGNESFDIIVNAYLLNQLYSSRLIARTGFYQSGGATGFRDQLQDVTALLYTDEARARQQLILCAEMQFFDGDVLHWRHDNARGVRTNISDDRLFLPLAAAEYVRVSGDESVLDELVSYLEAKPIPSGQKTLYDEFKRSDMSESLYMHCLRAIELTQANLGAHGLPLMGGGDWNDGMDGMNSGSESTVTALLLLLAAERFIGICELKNDTKSAKKLRDCADKTRAAIEKTWNGNYYTRAYFGNGEALETVDIVTAALACFAELEHAKESFSHAESILVDYENALIRLLHPPFKSEDGESVGYIAQYFEGARENGGQYTHAAAWFTISACALGLPEKAERFFAMLNPVEHGSMNTVNRYKTEPYAVCGDVYSLANLAGHGGWSFYTGAAGWLYRAATEHILGIKKRANKLKLRPCTTLDEFSFSYRCGENTVYNVRAVRCEKRELPNEITLLDDGKTHDIVMRF